MAAPTQARFGGRADFINGPRRYSTLGDLPGGRAWQNRIRSLRLGRTAIVTVWSDENFRGVRFRSVRLPHALGAGT